MGNYNSSEVNQYDSYNAARKLGSHNRFNFSQISLNNGVNKLPSDRSLESVYSSSRNWSRYLWRDKKLPPSDLETVKTYWPVSHTESIFLPEFKIKPQVTENDFVMQELISKGAFGKVYKVQKKDTGNVYAMKVLQKSQIIDNNTIYQVKQEVRIQSVCGHNPFIVSCPYYWQSRRQLFIVTEYVPGGELLQLLNNNGGPLPEDVVRIYIAELALALDFLHNAGIIYRDLKPENVLLDDEGHCQIIDFGLSKWLSIGSRTNTICGTLQYGAPEVLHSEPYSHAADWWSLGVIACLILTFQFPIRDGSSVNLPSEHNVSSESIDLLRRLLEYNPRYRVRSLRTLQTLAFFKNFNFQNVLAKKVSPRELLNRHSARFNDLDLQKQFVDF